MSSSSSPLGIFDSGIGGLSVLRALRALLPAEDLVYFADSVHAPYGERGDAFVTGRSLAIAQELIEARGAKLLVVACNTATAAAIALLRAQWPQVPIVGVEPALKPAADATRTGHVGVLATRGTLASAKFARLHDSLADRTLFRLQACHGLAAAIEADDAPLVATLCAQYVAALGPLGSAEGQIDTLVLGCTHYPFALPLFEQLAGPQVRILETGQPVARRVQRLLADADLLRAPDHAGTLTLLSPGADDALQRAAGRWLNA
ncbi:glutamate racemase [Ramlibacter sp. AN1015]|uniref:glutamate racemase n=1 Tax=Ramlibacter sp. AN1015 TaxID=3133428 RepID=UPI0030C26080